MQAGKLRHKLTIQEKSTTLGSRGEASTTWTDVRTARGSVITLGGRELELAKRLYSDATHRVDMRFFAGLTTEHRIKFGSRIFGIGAVDDFEQRGIQLIVLCAEAKN